MNLTSFHTTPLAYNTNFGIVNFNDIDVINHIPSGYVHAGKFLKKYKGDSAHLARWINDNSVKIAAITKFLTKNCKHELIDGKDIMFTIKSKDDMTKVYSGLSDDPTDRSKINLSTIEPCNPFKNNNDTYNAIKGTYVHPMVIVRIMEAYDTEAYAKNSAILVSYFKEMNINQAMLNDNIDSSQLEKASKDNLTNTSILQGVEEDELLELQEKIIKLNKKLQQEKIKHTMTKDELRDIIIERDNILETSRKLIEINEHQSLQLDKQSKKIDILLEDNKITHSKLDVTILAVNDNSKLIMKMKKDMARLKHNVDTLCTNLKKEEGNKETILMVIFNDGTFAMHAGCKKNVDKIITTNKKTKVETYTPTSCAKGNEVYDNAMFKTRYKFNDISDAKGALKLMKSNIGIKNQTCLFKDVESDITNSIVIFMKTLNDVYNSDIESITSITDSYIGDYKRNLYALNKCTEEDY